jgi:hypothetical protein
MYALTNINYVFIYIKQYFFFVILTKQNLFPFNSFDNIDRKNRTWSKMNSDVRDILEMSDKSPSKSSKKVNIDEN